MEEQRLKNAAASSITNEGVTADAVVVVAAPPTAQPALLASLPSTEALSVTLNGESVSVEQPDPNMMLAEWLRYERGLKGTKVSCAEVRLCIDLFCNKKKTRVGYYLGALPYQFMVLLLLSVLSFLL